MSRKQRKTGAEKARWDLSCLYSGPDDPRIDADLKTIEQKARSFYRRYHGRLDKKLGAAIDDFCDITMLCEKMSYFLLAGSVDLFNSALKAKSVVVQRICDAVYSDYLSFFYLEIAALDNATITRLARRDRAVKRYRAWVKQVQVTKENLLSAEVEAALLKRAAFGPQTWKDFYHELEAVLSFEFHGQKCSLTEMLSLLISHPRPQARSAILKTLNDGFSGYFAMYAAQSLNVIIGAKTVEDKERQYRHPMEERNDANGLDDETVEALHRAVKKYAGPLAGRYYQLKAKLLGLSRLKWSDRTAPVVLPNSTVGRLIPFEEAFKLTTEAYQSFSPTLVELIRQVTKLKRIDAAPHPGKESGAFNLSLVLPGGKPVSFTFLNYFGLPDDVMTLAHELGHAVHGLLAGEKQGALLADAPTAYAETASTFGETITFNYLKEIYAKDGNMAARLALLLKKIEETLGTTVRQIALSNFERKIHGAGKWLSVDEFCALWQESLEEMYGPSGQVFTYENTSHLWTYIDHFHRPFYVYSYAFGELLTHSLYARRQALGNKFEPLYLNLLRAGSSRSITSLLKPFGLDPNRPSFWKHGIEISLGAMIKEAEDLARELGYKIPE